MARIVLPAGGSGPEDPFEQKVLFALEKGLPDTYVVVPNIQLVSVLKNGKEMLEYDDVVLTPHGLCVVEAKEWYGKLAGDQHEWSINGKPKKNPLRLLNRKCQVLKSDLGGFGALTCVEPLLVVPDGTQVFLGQIGANVRNLGSLTAWLSDRARFRKSDAIGTYHAGMLQALVGKAHTRHAHKPATIGGYAILETVSSSAEQSTYIGRRALVNDGTRYRIRVFRPPYSADPAERERQQAIVKRPSEAVAQAGKHPNLLPVIQFEFLEDTNEFIEVTEWSDYGTLRGFLARPETQLTVREKLEIADGILAGLEAVHARGVVHRAVSPDTVLIGFDRRPLLTDFDRAFLESATQTVWAATVRDEDPAYLAPELRDRFDYDFDASADLYSLGAILYRLFVGEPPFPKPDAAIAAAGKPPKPPSASLPEPLPALDALVERMLQVDDFKGRPTANAARAVLRTLLDEESKKSDRPTEAPSPSAPSALEPPSFGVGQVVEPWRIDAELGGGSFSKVYRAFHLTQVKSYALKVFAEPDQLAFTQQEFGEISARIPAHPNLVKPVWLDRLPDGRPYLVSELVEGETLEAYCDGRKTLPWSEVKRVGSALLSALAVVHPDVLHRDVKPANIMLALPSGEPRLIDFNIAALARDAAGRSGTPRYGAPDRGRPGWRPDMDLFSLGVVLYELVTQRHPYAEGNPEKGAPLDPREVRPDLRLSTALAEFLLTAVAPDGARRFQTATAMRAALELLAHVYDTAAPTKVQATPSPLALEPWEVGKQNYNPYVTRLLTLYSQARRTNSGTRGLDEIGRLTYVPTRLDEVLASHVAEGRYRLVVVTGNAGDGKTAFLQQTEAFFQRKDTVVERMSSGNGSRWSSEGLRFETNYDGSQDEGDRANEDVLREFLAPFAGDTFTAGGGDEVRLIAINEGRLIDFLHGEHREQFSGLRRWATAALAGKGGAPGALLVNLNLRAVTSGGPRSLVERQLLELLRDDLWSPCEGCKYLGRCPLRHNADTLRDPASGAEVRARVRRLLEIVHLRRRMHVTMRDLRSALSWLVLRDTSCDDVGRLLERHDDRVQGDLAILYYHQAYGSDDVLATPADRLVRLLREVDVGAVEDPELDRRLHNHAERAVPWMRFDSRATHGDHVEASLHRRVTRTEDPESLVAALVRHRALLRRTRRRAYFERLDAGWQAMLPYRSLPLLEDAVRPDRADARAELRNRVLDAISMSEGLRSESERRDHLALRVSRVTGAPVRSYRLFRKDAFKAQVAVQDCVSEYLEVEPDAIRIAGANAASLVLSLDLLEMLELVRAGYRPTVSELQGLFVNLSIFRNELLSEPFSEVLVTPDDREFYRVTAVGEADGVHLTLERRPTAEESSP
ncbi:MAG: protein kinase [Deltaproteobacteria bacterium]|nr:protein kinase [Deltaproteobacteria bacterium]